jgi:hypothetical protein
MKKTALPPKIEDAATFHPPAPPADDARQALLDRSAIAVGDRWEEEFSAALIRQGRSISGAWPGTMTEARAQVSAYFLTEHPRAALTWNELERAARTSYARAKQRWLAR